MIAILTGFIQSFFTASSCQKNNSIAVKLQGTYLRGADLKYHDLERISLKRADLRESSLASTRLLYIDLSGANLEKVNLEEAVLINVRGITVEQVIQCKSLINIQGLPIPFMLAIKEKSPELMEWWQPGKQILKMSGPYLSEADLSKTNLRKANLKGAYMRYASLYEADLSEADLREANLSEVSFGEANLHKTNSTSFSYLYQNIFLDQ